MSDVEKTRAALVARCLNNLYGFYASLLTFNFLIMQKQKRNKIIQQNNFLIEHIKIFHKNG